MNVMFIGKFSNLYYFFGLFAYNADMSNEYTRFSDVMRQTEVCSRTSIKQVFLSLDYYRWRTIFLTVPSLLSYGRACIFGQPRYLYLISEIIRFQVSLEL
ncbi:uncharacterized protein [Rutidosis leptorrhynchoides]|uniref:uncharacterized protein isoform X2 n=1 Tax=Rutidosis leptorrhynchoides TaxID=125765 RepID=UPI003A9A0A75